MLAKVYTTREVIVPFANRKVEDGVFGDEENLSFAEAGLRDFVETI